MSSPKPNLPLEWRPDHPHLAHPSRQALRWQALLSLLLLAVAALMGWGAAAIPGDAGYGGVGANFLPWVVTAGLALCGALLLWHALSGGFRGMEASLGDEHPHWRGWAWVSAGLLLNAALIERVGFVLGCTLAYLLAVQGLRRAFGKPCNTWLADAASGLLIAAPVYWLFTRLLAINLPALMPGGWL